MSNSKKKSPGYWNTTGKTSNHVEYVIPYEYVKTHGQKILEAINGGQQELPFVGRKKIEEEREMVSKFKESIKDAAPKTVLDAITESEDMYLSELLWDEGGKWDTLTALAKEAPAGAEILVAGLDVVEMLLAKNISYSNSAMEPLNILSNATPEEQIKMHIDNKLTRLKHQKEFQNEDSLKDLAGYVILLMVLKQSQSDKI